MPLVSMQRRWPLAVLALAGVASGVGPLSAALLAVLLVVGVTTTLESTRPGPAFLPAVGLILFTLLMGAAVGSIEPSLSWIQTEGRSLVAIGVLAIGPVITVCAAPLALRIRNVLVATTSLSLLVAFSPMRSMVRTPDGRALVGWTSSHHAAGYLFAFLLVAIIVLAARHRHRGWLPSVAIISLATLLTTSRTTLLGCMGGIFVLIASAAYSSATPMSQDQPDPRALGHRSATPSAVSKAGPLVTGLAFCGLALLSAVSMTGVLSVSERLHLPSMEQIQELVAPAEDDLTRLNGRVDDARQANVLIRLNAWGRAVNDFTQSPLVGAGPGRFNDQNREASAVLPGVRIILDADRRVDDFGAHNVYLQLAAELGLMGLMLTFLVWAGTLRWMWRAVGVDMPGRSFVLFVGGFLAASGLVSNSPLAPGLVVPLLIAVALVRSLPPTHSASNTIDHARTPIDPYNRQALT